MNETTFIFSDKMYNRLKWLVQVAIPAFAALYFGIASIWGLPNAEAVVGTAAIIATFLGALIGISARQYVKADLADGQIVVVPTEEGQTLSLQLEKTPEELATMPRVSFRVVTQFPPSQ
jgi:hypothetical protein